MFPKKHVLWNKEAEWNALVGLSVPFLMSSVLLFLAWLTSSEPYKAGEITYPSTLGAAELSARRATERLVGDTKASGTSADRQRLDHFSEHSSRDRALVQTQKPLAAKSKSFPSVPAVRPEAFRRPIENPFEKIEKEEAKRKEAARYQLPPPHKLFRRKTDDSTKERAKFDAESRSQADHVVNVP